MYVMHVCNGYNGHICGVICLTSSFPNLDKAIILQGVGDKVPSQLGGSSIVIP